MTNTSPLAHYNSPPPLSPRLKQQGHSINTATNTDLHLKDILEMYKNDRETLRYILIAKAEEDKRHSARDMLKTEQARIQLKQLDMEYLREQSRMARYYDKTYQLSHPSTGPTTTDKPAFLGSSLPPPTSMVPSYIYGLAPVQQQVLARITGNHSDNHHLSSYGNHYEYPPSSPVAYPHSAHPLCPPTIKNTSSSATTGPATTAATQFTVSMFTPVISAPGSVSQPQPSHLRLQTPPTSSNPAQPSTPISPAIGNSNSDEIPTSATTTRFKRGRYSVSDQLDDKLSHNKVMEALKAKIQRGNGSPVSTTPTSVLPYRPSFADTSFHMDKRQRQLPKPIVTMNNSSSSSASNQKDTPGNSTTTPTTAVHTASPRSAKPILPPIDTSVGRRHHQHQQRRSSSPLYTLPAATTAPSTVDAIPSATQVSPSDQLIAMSITQRQERKTSHSSEPKEPLSHDPTPTITTEVETD